MVTPVVVVVDDDEDGVAAASPVLRRRSRAALPAAGAASPDSLDAFSLSPPVPKRRPPVSPIVLDDDTPPPPKRRLSGDPEPPGSVVPETPQSFVPGSLGSHPVVAETPNSAHPPSSRLDLAAAVPEIPGYAVPDSIDPDIVVAETPGFTTRRSVGPSTAPAFASASPQKLSGASCPISLDSDEELDDTGYTDQDCSKSSGPQTTFSAQKNGDSSLHEEETHNKEDNAQLIDKRKKNQEEKRLKDEEKARLAQEKKRKKEENKLLKNALKVQKAEQKKYDKEKEEWESGKNVLKSIVVEIDSTIVESGSVGGMTKRKMTRNQESSILLTALAQKELTYEITANSIRGSILWRMEIPQIGQYPASVSKVPYILFVLQAEEFCDLISGGSFFDHVLKVLNLYPTFTICYVTNNLMRFITRSERREYKNPSSSNSWKRPPVEEVFCKLATHYVRVHSRQCVDEAEVAGHVVGLTCSLANCKARKPLTWLSVHANGAVVPENFIDKALAKKSTWIKSLIAIPKVQPRHALAIWKKYPTMRSLLNIYMDPSKTDREKERLLEDLKCEGRLGDENRRLGPVCSKRVYRILMAQNGATEADDAEYS